MEVKEIKKKYIITLEFDGHELSMLQATLGLENLPDVTHKCFVEYNVKELETLYNQLIDQINKKCIFGNG